MTFQLVQSNSDREFTLAASPSAELVDRVSLHKLDGTLATLARQVAFAITPKGHIVEHPSVTHVKYARGGAELPREESVEALDFSFGGEAFPVKDSSEQLGGGALPVKDSTEQLGEASVPVKPIIPEMEIAALDEKKMLDISEEQVEAALPMEQKQASYTLKERVRFEGTPNGWILPLCGKPALLKQFKAVPTLLPSYIRKALASKPNENFLIFIANGLPMAQQIGSFQGRLNKSLRQCNKACVGLEELAREAVASLTQDEQDRIDFISWVDILEREQAYEGWYQLIMNDEECRNVIKETALAIIKYRVDSFSKKGLKCVTFFDENGDLLVKSQKVMKRYFWTQESIAREMTTLIWGFHCDFEEKSSYFNSLLYMTPNSTGMDLISGGANEIRNILEARNHQDLPIKPALHYFDLDLKLHE